MKIHVAKTAGFCFGVKRAVNLAIKAAEEHPNQPIYTLGPIIHNPQVVAELAQKGIHQIDDINAVDAGIVIIRSHGITRQILEQLQKMAAITLIDATCPFVRRAQEIVARMAREQYHIVIVGEHNHPEVAGLLSYGDPASTMAISSAEEIPEKIIASRKPSHKIVLLAQTTQSYDNFSTVANRLLPLKGETRCFNTICDATSDRQQESLDIAAESDCMVIIGGYASANTTRLYQLCRAIQPCSYHIETAEQLDPAWFATATTVGITAGASTPKWIIDSIVEKIRSR
ncbi:MAG: 4-hydroxy-3-methylbut-2-enyl diphosphate reductase [Deltaproteobacteria bacterium]|nr:4-hydroxy-3-methylbut-2-enyl diphosphate reductase [Candidatus Anaeroferrophillus wilburensis]MBN2889360.1 4-hydroxy-3-methylbut-2-enyl diphosphate reductase [Deltaproteobacteria bacterium]